MKGSRFPHSLALIFGMIVVAQLLTYLIPAGEYQNAKDKTVLTDDALTLALPPGRKLLIAAEHRILLPDGKRVELPGNCKVAIPGKPEIALGAGVEAKLPNGDTASFAAQPVLVGADGKQTHLPENPTIGIADGIEVRLADGREAIAFEATAIALPADSYRETSSQNFRADSFAYVPAEQAPTAPPYAFALSILKGMEAAKDIIFLVFIVGGVIAVVRATGAIDAMIGGAIRNLGHNRLLLVAGMVTLFAIGSSTIGMAEEYMPFIPILVAMCLALKLDAVVAMGIVYIGAGVGYGCAALNPFTVTIAKRIADTPITADGQILRWGLLALMIAIGVHHLLRYARRITDDPGSSLVADLDYSRGFEMAEDQVMTGRRMAVIGVFILGIAVFVAGAAITGGNWFIPQLCAIFIGIALLAAIIGGLSPNVVAERFCVGAAELTTTALLIGFARTIEVVLTDAKVIHTIVHGISETLNALDSPAIAANGMLVVQSVCNFLIPSGSGQAYVTMPIMAPVAELTNVGKETAVLAYQFGDGFTNMIVPTNALLMGMLALGRIPYQRWLRFIVPFMIKIYVVAIIVLAIAGSANFGS